MHFSTVKDKFTVQNLDLLVNKYINVQVFKKTQLDTI